MHAQLTMYKDAHCGAIPDIPLSNGSLYQPGTCWIDIYNAIREAQHFIYIAGELSVPKILENLRNAQCPVFRNFMGLVF